MKSITRRITYIARYVARAAMAHRDITEDERDSCRWHIGRIEGSLTYNEARLLVTQEAIHLVVQARRNGWTTI
jgi:hypothetical protein